MQPLLAQHLFTSAAGMLMRHRAHDRSGRSSAVILVLTVSRANSLRGFLIEPHEVKFGYQQLVAFKGYGKEPVFVDRSLVFHWLKQNGQRAEAVRLVIVTQFRCVF